ncbi:hypothetical protein [Amycolatopsis sacchari]|uniref:Phosphodiesterase n=1 Tax=Amycolatopsis sacchari TaxID=115433 RepID=A0A1I3XHH6_9PSEU|nr:hypothetical protein [Amycolatopsis sacchari]SFK18952.1 hypothetical protein SAMN05421835_115102 [Amycolatopsis sacchari]
MRLLRPAFDALAHVRHARAFHPDGVLADGTFTPVRRGSWPLPDGPVEVRARLSKGVGVPRGFRDVLGLAVRIPLETGPWDLTFSTIGPFGRVVPFPSAGWCEAPFSSLAPYRVDGGLRWLLAQAAGGQPDVDASLRAARRLVRGGGFELVVAEAQATGVPRPIAQLRLHTVCDDAEKPAFDPMLHHPPGVTLYPDWLAKARELAYAGSRAGRS